MRVRAFYDRHSLALKFDFAAGRPWLGGIFFGGKVGWGLGRGLVWPGSSLDENAKGRRRYKRASTQLNDRQIPFRNLAVDTSFSHA
jgi:hypothetical protein